jgi:hypothetical protein
MTTTLGKAFVGTQLAASIDGRSTTKDATETIVTYVTSSMPEKHAVE